MGFVDSYCSVMRRKGVLSSRTCRCVTLLSRHTQLSPSVETPSFTPRQERGQLTQRELVREGGGSSNWQEGLRVASTRRTSLEQVRRGRVQRVTGHVQGRSPGPSESYVQSSR